MYTHRKCHHIFTLIFAILLLGCPDYPVNKGNKEVSSDENKEVSSDENKETSSGENEEVSSGSQVSPNQNEVALKDLGAILFLGNSHTHDTEVLETMAKENGYALKAHHLKTGGHVPLGNDKYTFGPDSEIKAGANAYLGEDPTSGDHLSNFLNRQGAQLFPSGLSWIIVHDGSVYNSLTSAGAFMGLAAAFGIKTACYQSWDLPRSSLYAARQLCLPLIPVGYAIRAGNGKGLQYKDSTGHMNKEGAYAFSIAYLHFLTDMPIDSITGSGGLSLTEERKTEAKQAVKNAYARFQTESSANDGYYYDKLENFGELSMKKNCPPMEAGKEYTRQLRLGEPAIFRLPKNISGKRIQVNINSSGESVVGDVWFYHPGEKRFVAQGYNREYQQRYVYEGKGDPWEKAGTCLLIVTRRGATRSTMGEWELGVGIARIEEDVSASVPFSITASFVP